MLRIPIIVAVKFGQQKNVTSREGKEKDTPLSKPQQHLTQSIKMLYLCADKT